MTKIKGVGSPLYLPAVSDAFFFFGVIFGPEDRGHVFLRNVALSLPTTLNYNPQIRTLRNT
jgi:hypothetical protein